MLYYHAESWKTSGSSLVAYGVKQITAYSSLVKRKEQCQMDSGGCGCNCSSGCDSNIPHGIGSCRCSRDCGSNDPQFLIGWERECGGGGEPAVEGERGNEGDLDP